VQEGRRRLAAIIAADVAGYSRLMGADEEGTIAALRTHRQEVIEPKLVKYHGRIANTAGDSFLIEFPSAVNALRFAIEIQSEIAGRNCEVPKQQRLEFRIGINVGDVVTQGDDLLGDGVNVAARLEGLANPGGICISRTARDQVRDRMDIKLDDLGEIEVKNIVRPVRVFRVLGAGETLALPVGRKLPAIRFSVIAVIGLTLVVGGGIWWSQSQNDAGLPSAGTLVDPSQEHLSIAVLPFANLSEDKGQAYFADGIVEDITTDLSKVSGLFVASRSATLRFRKNSADPRRVGAELGVSHVLEGSVRRSGERVRLTAKLIDTKTGRQLWAERYDRETRDVFAIQDDISDRVVAELSKRLEKGSLNRVVRTYTPNLEAYDLYIQGRAKRIPPTPVNLAAALKMFEKAIKKDPKFAGGYAGAAYVYVLRYTSSNVNTSASVADLDTGLQLAQEAVKLDPSFGPAWGSLAWAYVRKRRFDDALDAIRMAMKSAPNDSLMRATYGWLLGHVGRPKDGIGQVQQAMRMSPDSLPLLYFLGANYRAAGEYKKAISALEEHRRRLGGRILPAPTSQLIAAYVQAGMTDKARAEVQKLLKVAPRFTSEVAARTHVYKSAEEMERYLSALQKAGLRK
jgi:adenylate cyclase